MTALCPPSKISLGAGRGALRTIRSIIAIAAISLAPITVRAKPVGSYSLIVQSSADETDPSIDAQYVVFASNASGDWDIVRYELPPAAALSTIAGGPGNQDQPDVCGTTVAYRGPEGIWIQNWDVPSPLRVPHPPAPGDPPTACAYDAPVSNPTVGDEVAAWECGPDGSRAVAVFRFGTVPEEYRLVPPSSTSGDEHAPAAFDRFVAYVDGGDQGSVWLHDSAPDSRGTTRICDGRASGVALGSYGRLIAAVARESDGHDSDIEIWDAEGLVTALRVYGVQQNPHVSLDWVAFEDLSTGHSQIVLWQWTSGIVFIPHPSTSNQTLNDIETIPGSEIRVVFADDRDGTESSHDIALYELVLENGKVPDGWEPPPWQRPPPTSCADPNAVVLATLVLSRDMGTPLSGSITFDAPPFPGDPVLPVLVCIDATHVSSGWVALDDEALANPSDFNPDVVKLQIPAVAESGRARLSGVIAGKPGSSLVARVLSDPGRLSAAPTSGGEAPPPGASHAVAEARTSSQGGGCGFGGDGGAFLGALALLLRVRLRRR